MHANKKSLWEKPRKAEKWCVDPLQSCFLKRHIRSWSARAWGRRSSLKQNKTKHKERLKGVSFPWSSWDTQWSDFFSIMLPPTWNFSLTRNVNKGKKIINYQLLASISLFIDSTFTVFFKMVDQLGPRSSGEGTNWLGRLRVSNLCALGAGCLDVGLVHFHISEHLMTGELWVTESWGSVAL